MAMIFYYVDEEITLRDISRGARFCQTVQDLVGLLDVLFHRLGKDDNII